MKYEGRTKMKWKDTDYWDGKFKKIASTLYQILKKNKEILTNNNLSIQDLRSLYEAMGEYEEIIDRKENV